MHPCLGLQSQAFCYGKLCGAWPAFRSALAGACSLTFQMPRESQLCAGRRRLCPSFRVIHPMLVQRPARGMRLGGGGGGTLKPRLVLPRATIWAFRAVPWLDLNIYDMSKVIPGREGSSRRGMRGMAQRVFDGMFLGAFEWNFESVKRRIRALKNPKRNRQCSIWSQVSDRCWGECRLHQEIVLTTKSVRLHLNGLRYAGNFVRLSCQVLSLEQRKLFHRCIP